MEMCCNGLKNYLGVPNCKKARRATCDVVKQSRQLDPAAWDLPQRGAFSVTEPMFRSWECGDSPSNSFPGFDTGSAPSPDTLPASSQAWVRGRHSLHLLRCPFIAMPRWPQPLPVYSMRQGSTLGPPLFSFPSWNIRDRNK
ncbi:hypothetical protein J6590_006654 [Homalodisca vitripennis]|nr:hypothetical protein J6590_006654 [Homalodisca vitripennis]